ncbi:MAG: hypothetical protein ABW185_13940 [Sedimenticola sp.]
MGFGGGAGDWRKLLGDHALKADYAAKNGYVDNLKKKWPGVVGLKVLLIFFPVWWYLDVWGWGYRGWVANDEADQHETWFISQLELV